MGYSYDHRHRLCCDNCGASGVEAKTRKRTCTQRVFYAEGGSLPYCPAPALCSTCYQKLKPTLHADCKLGADRSNAREVARKARLAQGSYERRTCWGSWHALVPDGFVGVRFVGLSGEQYRLVTADAYAQGGQGDWLEDYPDAQPWEMHA
jgi:hypothetical protein